jgi:hypothetical protein
MRKFGPACASEIWRELELRDAQTIKQKAAMSGNLSALRAAETWILAIEDATDEQVSKVATTCQSIASTHRARAIECLGHNSGGCR